MNDFTAKLSSAHQVKVALCYMLQKLDREITEKQLYEIILDSGAVNYFDYSEAVSELIKNGSVSKKEKDGESYIVLEEKGRMGSDYFNEYIPYHFRRRILQAAFSFFSRQSGGKDADISINEVSNGCEVWCTIKDSSFDLMRIALYAPDREQAELIKEKILQSPAGFYSSVISAALDNTEEKIDLDK